MDATAAERGSAGRRAAWSGRSSPVAGTARDKIIDATVTCISRHGLERTSIAAIASIAGVSRPTVYAYFDNRENLVSAALEKAAAVVTERAVVAARKRAKSAADYAVEIVVAVRREFRAEPALYPLRDLTHSAPWSTEGALSPPAVAFVRPFVAPILDYDPSLAPDLDEIIEMLVRWLISLLTFDSASTATDAKLRAYLHKWVAPSIPAGG